MFSIDRTTEMRQYDLAAMVVLAITSPVWIPLTIIAVIVLMLLDTIPRSRQPHSFD